MKKLSLLLGSLMISALILLPFKTQAAYASLLLSTSSSKFAVGSIFNVQVSVISNGNKVQVARAKITYPADLLLVQGFSQGTLFPEKSPGEIIGKGIIYVGGYRLGEATNNNGLLGEVSFKVLKPGVANVSLVSGSRIITQDVKDIYSGGNSIVLNLGSDQTNVTKAGQGKTNIEIKSETNPPDSWSKSNTAILNWSKPAGALGYVVKLSHDVLVDIGSELTTKKNTITYNNLADGIWIFQLKAKYAVDFSPIADYMIKIDSTPPNEPQPVIEANLDESGQLIYQVLFNTTDATSGIGHYEIKFDQGEYKVAISPYNLDASEKAANYVYVKAFDLAGNKSIASTMVSEYIKQKGAQALFDVQANSAKRSWLDFYLILSAIIAIFIIISAFLIVKRSRDKF